jgi:hypothetical protein
MKRALVRAGIGGALLILSNSASLAGSLVAGIGFGSPVNRGRVITVNEASAVGTLLPGAGAGTAAGLNGLAFDASGVLYGTEIGNPVFADPTVDAPMLVKLDPATGVLLFSVPITFGGNPLEVLDLAVQPGTGLIYGTSFTSTIVVAGDLRGHPAGQDQQDYGDDPRRDPQSQFSHSALPSEISTTTVNRTSPLQVISPHRFPCCSAMAMERSAHRPISLPA